METDLIYGYFGHHKAATTWTVRIVRQVCGYLGLKVAVLPNDRVFSQDLPGYVRENGIDFVCYINADFDHVRQLPGYRGFHVVRDPRDIVVSSYFSSMYSHPTTATWPALVEHRARLQALPKEEGLALEIEASQWEFGHLRKWDYHQPSVLELRMEDLTRQPMQGYQAVFRFLGLVGEAPMTVMARLGDSARMAVNSLYKRSHERLPIHLARGDISLERLSEIIEDNSFAKLAGGRPKGEEDVKSHYRKGVAGDWRNHFSEAHKALFKSMYNDILIDLAYENDPDW